MYIKSFKEFSTYVNDKKVVLFGTGGMCRQILKRTIDVAYFVDNDNSKWGKNFLGSTIKNPNILLKENKEQIFIIIASTYFEEISFQLKKMGFKENVNFLNGEMMLSNFYNYFQYEQLMKYKDIYKGKRAFIIGNGPSLRVSDLDKLKKEITFACNKIYLAFDETDWRPTYYAVIDSKVAEYNKKIISNLNLNKFVTSNLQQFFSLPQDINWLRPLSNPVVDGEIKQGFSQDIFKGIYGGYTVTYVMLQIAFYMGIREVYLLGIDYSFEVPKPTGETSIFGEILLESKGERNHFHPNYRTIGEKWTMPKLDEQYKAFLCAKEVFEENSGKIYNASRKTKLDIFPIVDFDEIL